MELAQDLIEQLMQEQVHSCFPLFFQRLKLIVVSNPGPGASEVQEEKMEVGVTFLDIKLGKQCKM